MDDNKSPRLPTKQQVINRQATDHLRHIHNPSRATTKKKTTNLSLPSKDGRQITNAQVQERQKEPSKPTTMRTRAHPPRRATASLNVPRNPDARKPRTAGRKARDESAGDASSTSASTPSSSTGTSPCSSPPHKTGGGLDSPPPTHRQTDASLLYMHIQHNIDQSRMISFHTSRRRILRTRAFTLALRATRRLISSYHCLYDLIHQLDRHCQCASASTCSLQFCSARILQAGVVARRSASVNGSVDGNSAKLCAKPSQKALHKFTSRKANIDHDDDDKDYLLQCLGTLETNLRQSRERALSASPSITVAQDVFVLISIFLGLCTTPPLTPSTRENLGRPDAPKRSMRWSALGFAQRRDGKLNSKTRFPRRASAPSMSVSAGAKMRRTESINRENDCEFADDCEFVDDCDFEQPAVGGTKEKEMARLAAWKGRRVVHSWPPFADDDISV